MQPPLVNLDMGIGYHSKRNFLNIAQSVFAYSGLKPCPQKKTSQPQKVCTGLKNMGILRGDDPGDFALGFLHHRFQSESLGPHPKCSSTSANSPSADL